MLIGLQKAVINSEPQNAVKSRKKKNQVRNDGYSALFSRKAVATVIVNGKEFKNWKILKTPANDDWAVKSFIKLKKEEGSKILDNTFVGDIGRAEYIVNGENIPRIRGL